MRCGAEGVRYKTRLTGSMDAATVGSRAGILPRTHTPEMFSWFPIFFPFTVRGPRKGALLRSTHLMCAALVLGRPAQTPLYVRQGARIDISFWRKNNGTKVRKLPNRVRGGRGAEKRGSQSCRTGCGVGLVLTGVVSKAAGPGVVWAQR